MVEKMNLKEQSSNLQRNPKNLTNLQEQSSNLQRKSGKFDESSKWHEQTPQS